MTILDSTEAEVEVLGLAEGRDTTDLNDKNDDTLIAEARWHAQQAREHHQRSIWHGIECGRRIQVLHDRFARRPGRPSEGDEVPAINWATVVAEEIGVGQSQAYNYMELARPENSSALESLGEDASVTAALETLHEARRQERRERARAERAARTQYPVPVSLPEHLNIDVGDAGSIPLPDGLIDLIVTSPPYGLGMSYHESDDNEGYETYLEHVLGWCDEMFRVSSAQGRICLNVPLDISRDGGFFAPKPIYADWVSALTEAGWRYRTTIVWNEGNITRTTARGSVDSPNSPHVISRVEMIAVMYKGSWNLDQPGASTDLTHDEWLEWTDGLWTFPGARPISESHCPAPFPEELPRRCMRLFSFPGDVVLDPFLGSGTTGVVAAQIGRRFYGFDKSLLYCEQARERISHAIAHVRTNGHVAQQGQPATIAMGA